MGMSAQDTHPVRKRERPDLLRVEAVSSRRRSLKKDREQRRDHDGKAKVDEHKDPRKDCDRTEEYRKGCDDGTNLCAESEMSLLS